MNYSRLPLSMLACCVIHLAIAPSAKAHFPWLITDNQGHAVFFFGESVADRTHHLPETLENIDVLQLNAEGAAKKITLRPLNTDSLVGRRSEQALTGNGMLVSTGTYGVYHGTKLTYYMQHFLSDNATNWPTESTDDLSLQILLATDPAGLKVTVLWKGKPLADSKVKLFCQDGDEEAAAKTDANGKVFFDASSIEAGLGAVLVGHVDKTDSGTVGDEEFSSATHYVTTTFVAPETIVGKQSATSKDKPKTDPNQSKSVAVITPSGLPDLPETLTSFGGAIAGDVLYVYGGHTGQAHSYSVAEQSDQFYALSYLNDSAKWQKLASGPRLQGLALVPHGEDVIRIGGFTAINAEGEDHDLRSQADVVRYDVSSGTWESLPSLPEPRSSHDAAVLGNHVYVVGGWQLNGDDPNRWHSTAWKLDLENKDAQWKSIAAPPTTRRALSLAGHDGQLYAIGGMKDKGGPTTVVEFYDPASDRWTKGPNLPGAGMNGFGNSACSAGGNLYVTTIRGNALRLSDDGKKWIQIAKVDPSRFFHRMLPASDKSLLLIGGANMKEGKYTGIDRIEIR